jgi:3'(2'), 5'-bisphosphate nucleotidase
MLHKEKEIALQAVSQAMALAGAIQKELSRGHALTKTDRSPVTVADFAVQALICQVLRFHFPGMPIVGEEDSLELRKPENRELLARIIDCLKRNDAPLEDHEVCDCIDLGGGQANGTFWTLDPIDGTKGFLRREQFAIAMALVLDGQVGLGVLGCPNLPPASGGTLFWAMPGQGSWRIMAQGGSAEPIRASMQTDPRRMKFVESYESSHSDKNTQLEIARRLRIDAPPEQMDSQVKYGVVASGSADIYLRIPHPATADYKEKIWDHAAGSLIVEEAGGWVSDIDGRKLDFSAGKTLRHNRGILATNGRIHSRVLEIIAELDSQK